MVIIVASILRVTPFAGFMENENSFGGCKLTEIHCQCK